MSKFLPTNEFKWIDPKDFDLNKYTKNNSKGCVLEVDLEYPKELRELHNNYLLDSNKIEVKYEEKYVFHYENLQLYLRLGLKLKKTHRVLKFNQSQ